MCMPSGAEITVLAQAASDCNQARKDELPATSTFSINYFNLIKIYPDVAVHSLAFVRFYLQNIASELASSLGLSLKLNYKLDLCSPALLSRLFLSFSLRSVLSPCRVTLPPAICAEIYSTELFRVGTHVNVAHIAFDSVHWLSSR